MFLSQSKGGCLERYTDSETGSEGKVSIRRKEHKTVVVVVCGDVAVRRTESGVDVKKEPLVDDLVSHFSQECPVIDVLGSDDGLFGISVVKIRIDKFGLYVKSRQSHVVEGEYVPFVGGLDKQTFRVGIVHNIPSQSYES